MKTLFLSDHINLIHWSILKSIMLVLILLPVSHALMQLCLQTEGGSQIIVGFVAISVFSALSIVSFISALLSSNLQLHDAQQINHRQTAAELIASQTEQRILRIYRLVPMMFMLAMMSYLSSQY